jgi:hypothetical protein
MMITSSTYPSNIDWICYDLFFHHLDRHRIDDINLSFINPFIDPFVTLNTTPYARADL